MLIEIDCNDLITKRRLVKESGGNYLKESGDFIDKLLRIILLFKWLRALL